MPKLPDPTLISGSINPNDVAKQADSTGQPTGKPTEQSVPEVKSEEKNAELQPQIAKPSDAKQSPFKFVGFLFVGALIVALGFAAAKYIVMPRLVKPETVVLSYWGLWEPESVMAPVIAKFEQENPGISVKYQMQSKVDYRERLQSALARNEGPDIMRLHATWLPMFNQDLAPATSDQYSLTEFSQTFYPGMVTDLVKEASVVAVPLMTDGLALLTNDEILASTNSGIPANWDEFRKTAFALTVRDGRGNIVRSGAAMGTTNNITHWSDVLAVLMLQNSVDLTRPAATIDAKGRNLGADALKFYAMFSAQDRIWDETLPTDVIAFANGKVAMMFAPSWEVFEILRLNPNLKFSVNPIPQLTSQRKVSWASYWVEGVSKRSKHPKEAWKLLKFLSSQDGLQLVYAETTKTRPFGEAYPRIDMAKTLMTAQYIAPYVAQVPDAKSWYMSSRTGDRGINDEIIAYWADAVNSVIKQKSTPEVAIVTAAKGVGQVLTKYGVK